MSYPESRTAAAWTAVVLPVAGLLVVLAVLLPWNETFVPVICVRAPCPQPDPETPSGVTHLGPFVVVPLAAASVALLRPLWFLLAGDGRGARVLTMAAVVLCGLAVLVIGFDILAPLLGDDQLYDHGDDHHIYREPRFSGVALVAAVLSLVAAAATHRSTGGPR